MHFVLVAVVVCEEVSVEKGGRLVLIFSSSIRIVDVESESQTLVYVYGKVSLEPFFSIPAVTLLVVSEVGEGRLCVGVDDVARLAYREIVRVIEKELARILAFEEYVRDARRSQVS